MKPYMVNLGDKNRLGTTMITQSAHVAIERPERYAKQLASHMGNKVPTEAIDGGWKLTFDIGSATLLCKDTTLTMTAVAENLEDLKKIEFALVKHLVKFAVKLGELEIEWH
jgi:hypothetical protein